MFFVLKSSAFWRRKCPPGRQPCPAAAQAGLQSILVLSVPYLLLLLFFKSPQCSYTHELFRVKPFWNPGMKAISFINHLPPTPLSPLHPSSERKLTMENSVILWLNRERRVPPPWLPGDITRNPTISGCVNECDNLRHLGRYYTSPSNMLASRCSHVFICFYFWLR